MPLLLYFVAPEQAPDFAAKGVGDAAVQYAAAEGLRCYYSEFAATENAATAALQFHRVIQQALHRGPVIPFRYPTVVRNADALREPLVQRGARFRAHLADHAGHVQMEVRLRLTAQTRPQPQTVSSGAAYLRQRAEAMRVLDRAAETCRESAPALEWRRRDSGDMVRCYFLVDRTQSAAFPDRLRAIQLPEQVTAIVSGPWPPMEFLEDEGD